MADPSDFIEAEMARLRADGLLRRMRTVDGPQDTWCDIDGRRALVMCSNNYLGIANHPEVREAAARAALDLGGSAAASRLISGSMRIHHALEEEIADWKGCERALLFTSGYQANVGVITSLVGRGDEVFSDELNHASLIDGCRLSRAKITVYPHANTEILADQLAASRARRRLIVTDSIFSMDGDRAPLREICELAERYEAMVLVDEAHASGVTGPSGSGLIGELGLRGRVTVQMGTLGKALGSFGAFIAARGPVVDYIVNRARSFIFTTALPPAAVGAAAAAVRIVRRDDSLRNRLVGNSAHLAAALAKRGIVVPAGHIVPVAIGGAEATMQACEALLARGVFVQGIRPPTVPPGTSRLRLTLMSSHQPEDIELAARVMCEVLADSVPDAPAAEAGR